jgi:hypothetical protein
MRKYGASLCGLICFVMMLAGCGGGDGTGPAPAAVTSTRQYQSLQFTLTTRTAFRRGETVPMTFTVKNVGSQTVTAFLGPPEADAQVSQGGRQIWRWSDGKAFPAVVYNLSFAPGESKTYQLDWDQKDSQGDAVPSGTYALKPWFNTGRINGVPVSPQQDLAAEPIEVVIR